MTILIDADACPVTAIAIRLARQHSIPVVLVTDVSHVIHSDYAEVVTVGQGADAADLALINRAKTGDIVITQDYGVAALALGKGASALHQSGMRYTNENIDLLLSQRHESRKARKAGMRTAGPKKRTAEEDAAFERELRTLMALTLQKR